MNFHHPHPSIFHVDQTPPPQRPPTRRTPNMPRESLFTDSIVQRAALDWRGQDPDLTECASLQAVTAILSQFPTIPPGRVFVFYGHAHSLLLPHPANPTQATLWTPARPGAAPLRLVFPRPAQPPAQVHPHHHPD